VNQLAGTIPTRQEVFDAFSIAETSYGFRKRIRFILDVLDRYSRPGVEILDVGCGTGQLVSAPLARLKPDSRVTAVDVHPDSIAHAREKFASIANLSFESRDLQSFPAGAFDVIICSEVLEHVHEVDSFLSAIIEKLRSGGILIVTVPNGRGPFEIQSWVWRHLFENALAQKAIALLRRRNGAPKGFLNRDSGHVNFFRFGPLVNRLKNAGLELLEYEGRTFLAGPFAEPLMFIPGLLGANSAAGTSLPPWAVSGWMFALRIAPPKP
jgi:SAM-dependent methyltransferase